MCVLTDYFITGKQLTLIYNDNQTSIVITPWTRYNTKSRHYDVVGIDEITIKHWNRATGETTAKHTLKRSDRLFRLAEVPLGAEIIVTNTWLDYFNWPQCDKNPDFNQAHVIIAAILNIPLSQRKFIIVPAATSPSVL